MPPGRRFCSRSEAGMEASSSASLNAFSLRNRCVSQSASRSVNAAARMTNE